MPNKRRTKKSKNIFNFLKNREIRKSNKLSNVKNSFWLRGHVYNSTTHNNKKKMGILDRAAVRKRPKSLKKQK